MKIDQQNWEKNNFFEYLSVTINWMG